MSQVLNLEEMVDGRKFGRFNINLLIWSFLAMLAGGFDLAGLASAAPELARTWHVAPKAFAPALSASLFGILFGAPLLGHARVCGRALSAGDWLRREADFQGELCLDHAVAVGVLRERAHGKLFSQLSRRCDKGWLLVSLVLGRFGFTVIALLFLFATLAIAAIGLPGLSYVAMVTAVTLSGFCTLGAQFGNNAASGLLYPTASRSSGVGWAMGIGRFGSIAGPLVGGLLIGLKVPPRQFFMLAAVPMVAGLIASVCVARLCYQMLGGVHLDEMAQAVSPKTTTKLLDDPI